VPTLVQPLLRQAQTPLQALVQALVQALAPCLRRQQPER
jgi:hypothetical protein